MTLIVQRRTAADDVYGESNMKAIWGLMTLAVAGATLAKAQSVGWRVPEYAELRSPGQPGYGRPVPFLFSAVRGGGVAYDLMKYTSAGTPGLVLAGKAVTGSQEHAPVPATPYVAKVSPRDGRPLWRWRPDDLREGQFDKVVVDSSGNVLAVGRYMAQGNDFRSFLAVKLNGASGKLLWRVEGTEKGYAYGVAIDPHDDVLVTRSAAQGTVQEVVKYASANGAVLWSSRVDARDDFDDFEITLDGAGNAVIGGYYMSSDDPNHDLGAQLAKFRANDGALLWSRRVRDPYEMFGVSVYALRALPNGDLIAKLDHSLVRLNGADGSTRWHRDETFSDGLDASGVAAPRPFVDSLGRLYLSGYVPADDGVSRAAVERLDPESGVTLWVWQAADDGSYGWGVTNLAEGTQGELLAGMGSWSARPFRVAAIKPDEGTANWVTRFGSDVQFDDYSRPVGLLQTNEGSIFLATYDWTLPGGASWAQYKLTGPFADDIFAAGCD